MAIYPSLFSVSLVSRWPSACRVGVGRAFVGGQQQRVFHSRLSFVNGHTASEARSASRISSGTCRVNRNLTGNVWDRSLTSRFRSVSVTGHGHGQGQRRFGTGTGADPEKKVASSNTAAAKKAVVHENIYTIPNFLTASRLVVAPIIGYCILSGSNTLALSLFAYAAVTDLVDGYIARKWNQQTVVGTVIDPMADKFLMTIGVVCLAMKASIPMWLAGLILARDVGLAFAAIYYRWISLPPPKTMTRYWDFSLPSAEVKPTEVSKVNTALQLALLGSAMAMPVLPEAVMTAWYLQEGMVGLQ
ncbi:phosphatidyl synthase [Microsporum canis CBS 113480]|uniref:Phosphatidyl synthase n=1 Tax=Arthroderma otae (strain ATCC MYA-4605 / CBS 113480) TaxID=554155 RepID=C5FRU9_ARTOC|nr:phosphatidyl synthase [Microsporum canis CBS 113480]EEQ32602.1 phosphatidyl synthase [Microsporum canis CBS 113480]